MTLLISDPTEYLSGLLLVQEVSNYVSMTISQEAEVAMARIG